MRWLIVFMFPIVVFAQEISADQAIRNISAYLDSEETEDFGLSIAIAKDGQIIYKDAFGYADKGLKVKNTTSTKFNIASTGKILTAISIMQLQEKGLLLVQDPVYKHTKVLGNGYSNEMNIHQLLTHTSGLPLFFYYEFDSVFKGRERNLDDFINQFDMGDLDTSRIGSFNYSNVGYYVLGKIIEEKSGMEFSEYVSQNILDIVGMTNTSYYGISEIKENSARGYVRPESKDDYWKENSYINIPSGPAGGCYSTPEDLLKLYNALENNSLISKASFDAMKTTQTDNYGYGMQLDTFQESEVFGHEGGYYGVRAELKKYESLGYTVSITANSDQTDYTNVSHYVRMILANDSDEIQEYYTTQELILAVQRNKGAFVIDRDPEGISDDWLEIRGYYYLNRNELDKAIEVFTIAVEVFDNNRALMNLFKAQNRKGDLQACLMTMERFVALNPENEFAKKRVEDLKLEMKGCTPK